MEIPVITHHVTQLFGDVKVIKNYTFKKELGSGAFGEVFLAEKENKKFAIKVYNHMKIDRSMCPEKLKEMVDTERKFLIQADHPNIIKVHDTFLSEKHLYLVMDYLPDGDLRTKVIKSKKLLSEAEAVRLLKDITSAMYFASQEGVRHRDIKPENILIQGENFVLADFGTAKITINVATTFVGTRPFMSPQILNQESYNSKCDVWSLGMTVYILLFGKDPFGRWKMKDGNLIFAREKKIQKEDCGANILFPSKPAIKDGIKNILRDMLEFDEIDRLSWGQLKSALQNFTGDFRTESLPIEQAVAIELKNSDQSRQLVNASIIDNECIKVTAKGYKDSQENIPDTEIVKIERLEYSPDSEGDVEAIQRFLMMKLRLCHLYLSVIYQIKELSLSSDLQDFKGWLSAASALMCKKLTEVCEYCFSKLSSKHKFTNFISSKFHQNGFAKQYLKDFYELNINAGSIQDEAVSFADSILSDKLDTKKTIIEVASSKTHHQRYQNMYNLVAFYLIKKTEMVKGKGDLLEESINYLEQIIGWIYFVGNYEQQLLNRANQSVCDDGFEGLIKMCENPKYIRETYENAKKFYNHFFS